MAILDAQVNGGEYYGSYEGGVISVAERKSKVVSLEEAAAIIGNGMMVAFGGIHQHNGPIAIIHEIIRRGVKHLSLVPNASAGIPADILIGAGCVDLVYDCYVGMEELGLAPNFRRAFQEGRIKVKELDEPSLVCGLRAGAADLPFYVLPKGHGAISISKLNPDFKLITDPYTGEEVYAIPPIQPDVGLIHVAQCDPYGNARILGSIVADQLLAKASNRVIITAEEIIDVEETKADPKRTTIPGFMVDMVVHVPYGAHPTSCHGVYFQDDEHLAFYKSTPIDDYLNKYVLGVTDHYEYLEKIGIRKLLGLRQNPDLLER